MSSTKTSPMTQDRPALDRWKGLTDGPLLVLALAFLVVFLLPLYRPGPSSGIRGMLLAANIAIWLAFAIDYGVRLYLSDDRRLFVRRHVPDLLTLAVPFLRPLRLLRVVGLLGSASRRAGERPVAGTTAYVLGVVALLLLVGAGLILDAERGAAGANITNAQDALWWAATTVTTVGYGDRFPVTGEGRLVAVSLMLGGIALLGVVTASIAAWFVQKTRSSETGVAEPSLHDVLVELRLLRSRLEEVAAAAAEQRPGHGGTNEASASSG